MKKKKYLTMFLAGTIIASSVQVTAYADKDLGDSNDSGTSVQGTSESLSFDGEDSNGSSEEGDVSEQESDSSEEGNVSEQESGSLEESSGIEEESGSSNETQGESQENIEDGNKSEEDSDEGTEVDEETKETENDKTNESLEEPETGEAEKDIKEEENTEESVNENTDESLVEAPKVDGEEKNIETPLAEKENQESPNLEKSDIDGKTLSFEAPEILIENEAEAYENSTEVNVTINAPNSYEIYYTTDGSDPKDESNPQRNKYEDKVIIKSENKDGETVILKASALYKNELNADVPSVYSDISEKQIVFGKLFVAETVNLPVINIINEEKNEDSKVYTIEITADSDKKIYYTLDGSDPKDEANASRTEYIGTFDVTANEGNANIVISASCASNNDGNTVYSDTATKNIEYTKTEKVMPVITLDKQKSSYSNDDIVTATMAVSDGYEIYYTLDGTDPSDVGILYTNPIEIKAPSEDGGKVIINAIAKKIDVLVENANESVEKNGDVSFFQQTESSLNLAANTNQLFSVFSMLKVDTKIAAYGNGENAVVVLDFQPLGAIDLAVGEYRIPLSISDWATDSAKQTKEMATGYIDTQTARLVVSEDGQGVKSASLKVDILYSTETLSSGKISKRLKTFLWDSPEEGEYDVDIDAVSDSLEDTRDYMAATGLVKYHVKTISLPVESLTDVFSIKAHYNSTSASYGDETFKINLGTPTTDEEVAEPVTYEINSQTVNYGTGEYIQDESLTLTVDCKSISATRGAKVYYTTDPNEDINENSKYITSSGMQIIVGKSASSNIIIENKDEHTLTAYVRMYIEGLGFTEKQAVSIPLSKEGIGSVTDEDTGIIFSGSTNFITANGVSYYGVQKPIPYDVKFDAKKVTDSSEISNISSKLKQKLGEDSVSSFEAYDISIKNADESNMKISDFLKTTSIDNYLISEENWGSLNCNYLINATERFPIGALKFYKINTNGEVIEMTDVFKDVPKEWRPAYSALKPKMEDINDDLSGTFIVMRDALPDSTLTEGNYKVPVEIVDEIDDAVLHNANAFVEKESIVAVGASSKDLYLNLKPSNGKYIQGIKYKDYVGNKTKTATVLEEYSINGVKYPKLVKISLTSDSPYIDSSFSIDNVYQAGRIALYYGDSAAGSMPKVSEPIISTSTGASNFVNDGVATVSISTYAVDGDIYYTTDGSEPDTSIANQKYTGPFTLSTANKDGESFTVKAIVVKSGMENSVVSEKVIVFKKEGAAAETVSTPKIIAKYDYSDSSNGTTPETGKYRVSIESLTSAAKIYYTTDGSEPTEQSSLYNGEFVVNAMTGGHETVIKAIGIADGYNSSNISEDKIIFSTNWWDNIADGESYEVPVNLLNFSEYYYYQREVDSMGSSALKEKARLTSEDGKKYLYVPISSVDVGSIVGYLKNLWYFENNDVEIANQFGNNNDSAPGMFVADYKADAKGYIYELKLPLFDSSNQAYIGLQATIDIMGKQRAIINIDYSDAIEKITNKEVVKVEKAETPIINFTYDETKDAYKVNITSENGAKIKYALSDGETASGVSTWLDYKGEITISGKDIVVKDGMVNVLSYAQVSGKEDSKISLQKLTFKDFEDGNKVIADGVYNVPVSVMHAYDANQYSMANGALDGDAKVTVANGKAFVDISFKAVEYTGLYGHLLKMWGIPGSSIPSDYMNNLVETTVVKSYEDYGMNYTSGDMQKFIFPKVVRVEREKAGEDYFFIRVQVDAMAGFDQNAKVVLDWSKATLVDEDIKKIATAPIINVSKNEAKNQEAVSVTMSSETEGGKIYYTTDGTSPTESSNLYTNGFNVTGENKTVTIKAVTVKDGYETSGISTTNVKFAAENSGGGSTGVDVKEDGKYWVDIALWNANENQASMGDVAFSNNRQALITTSGGVSKIQIATNPVEVSGYKSALKDIRSSEVNIKVVDRNSFTTNTKYDGKEHEFDYISVFQFNVNDTEDEYIDVEVNVPYTPMDNVFGGAGTYIKARIKIDWGTIKQGQATDVLIPVSSSASGSVAIDSDAYDKKDEETGIRIVAAENIIENGAVLSAKEVKEGKDFENAEKLLNNEFSNFAFYDVRVKKGEENLLLSTNVKLYFPIDKKFDINKVVIYRINDDNTKTLVEGKIEEKNYVIETNKLGIFAICESAEVVQANATVNEEEKESVERFSDTEEHWAKDAINFVVEKGIFAGVSDTEFGPDTKVSRGMLVTVFGRMAGVSETMYRNSKFKDVSQDDYFASFVAWAETNGIASGVALDSFAPNEEITREQMALMLVNFAKYLGVEFKADKSYLFKDKNNISSWANDAVETLAKAGIMNGRENGEFDPKGTATRAECAVMLMKFYSDYLEK